MRQYIILLNGDSISGCGNDWTISTEYRQYAKIMEVVGNMMRWNKDAKSAYIITECQYTQKCVKWILIILENMLKK